MKLLRGDGRTLEVREVGQVVYRLTAGAYPIKFHGWRIVDEAEAREVLLDAKAAGAVSDGKL